MESKINEIVSSIISKADNYMFHIMSYTPRELVFDCCLYILYIVKENLKFLDLVSGDLHYVKLKEMDNFFFKDLNFASNDSEEFKRVSRWFEHQLREIDHAIFIEAYPIVLEQLFQIQYYENGRSLINYGQPESLTHLVSALIKHYGIKSIYNPFAGLGSYSRGLDKDVKFVGQEINNLALEYAHILQDAHNNPNVDIRYGDPFDNWINTEKDAIVSTMPWGFRNNKALSHNETSEEFFLRKASKQANISIGVYPQTILYRSSSASLRSHLIDTNLIDTIIYLPERLFANTNTRSCIIITNKNQMRFGSVKFIDASSLFRILVRRKGVDLNVHEIMSFLDEVNENQYVHYVSAKDIYANDFDLSLEKYIGQEIDEPQGFKLHPLKELVTFVGISKNQAGTIAPVIKVSNLSKTESDYVLDKETLSKEEYQPSYKVVTDDVVLVSRIRKLDPTIYINDGQKVFINSAVLALKVTSDRITEDYLVHELHKDYVQKQLLFRGTGQPMISLNDLKKVRILVPEDRSVLKRYVKEETGNQLQALRKQLEQDKLAFEDSYRKGLRMRKHAISQVLQDLLIAFDDLEDMRTANGGVLKDKDIISPLDGSTVASYFQKMSLVCHRVDGMVKSLTDESTFGEPEEFNLGDFLEEYKQSHIQHGYVLDVRRDYLHIDEYENDPDTGESTDKIAYRDTEVLDNYIVNISKKDLTQVLDNILANARKYAFAQDDAKNVVKMEMDDDTLNGSPAVSLYILNNGAPLPKNMTPEKVFEWGQSSSDGTGIGGWEMRTKIEHYHGEIRLLEFDKPEENGGFTLAYEIKLPIKEEL